MTSPRARSATRRFGTSRQRRCSRSPRDDAHELPVPTTRDRHGVEHAVPPEVEGGIVDEVREWNRYALPTAPGSHVAAGSHLEQVLELIVRAVGRHRNLIISVVVVLQVDLERVVLSAVCIDPESEVRHAAQIGRVGAPRSRRRSGHAPRAPSSAERRSTADLARGRGRVGMRCDPTAPTLPPKENQPLLRGAWCSRSSKRTRHAGESGF